MSNPLFQNILPEDIPIMLKRLHAYTKSYQKEEYIRHAGDPADFIGIVESGSIHVLQDDYYGNRNITASIFAGSLFGEAFVCAGIPHLPVDIVAAEDCTIMFLKGKKLQIRKVKFEDLDKYLSKDSIGYTLNPFGVNLVLKREQIPELLERFQKVEE